MWLWSKLSSKKWHDAWDERFYGNTNAVITELSTGKSLRVEVYCEKEKDAELIQKQFGGSVRELKSQNWVAMSEVKRPPLMIRESLIITAETDQEELSELQEKYPKRGIIKIPAEMAFGTGDHATTSTCLRLLVDISKERNDDWEVLDLGCGTAILAIAGRMLGAKSGEAHDFDPQAVKVSKSNLKLNKIDNVAVYEQDVLEWEPKRQWEVLTVNMFSTILQKAFPTIVESMLPDADLIISGILKDQWEETRESAESHGIIFSKVVKKGKWVTARARLKAN